MWCFRKIMPVATYRNREDLYPPLGQKHIGISILWSLFPLLTMLDTNRTEQILQHLQYHDRGQKMRNKHCFQSSRDFIYDELYSFTEEFLFIIYLKTQQNILVNRRMKRTLMCVRVDNPWLMKMENWKILEDFLTTFAFYSTIDSVLVHIWEAGQLAPLPTRPIPTRPTSRTNSPHFNRKMIGEAIYTCIRVSDRK